MAHPYNAHRQTKVEHSRVGPMTKGYASGGGVHSDVKADSKLIKKMVKSTALKLHGGSVGSRTDKPKRAAGGKVNKGKGTTVNVIVSGVGKPDKPMMPPMPPKPPTPPMAGPPPGGPPMPPGGAPVPGMPPMRAKGGKVDAAVGTTPVQSQNMKETALKNVGRGPVVTK